jgi:hypothetical protein
MIRPVGRFPPAGPLGRVPRAQRYYQPTPIAHPPSRRASLPSLGSTLSRVLFAPAGRTPLRRTWTASTAAPAPRYRQGTNEPSQVPGRPLRPCPALRPRRSVRIRPLSMRPLWPSAFYTASAPQRFFRGSITRPSRFLCTLRRRGHPHTSRDRNTARATLGPGLAVSAFPLDVPV